MQDLEELGDDAEENEDEEETEMKRDHKMTKSELYKAYSGRGPTAMFAELMADRDLQKHAIVITDVAAPLETEYCYDRGVQSQGKLPLLDWAAARSAGGEDSWWGTISEILHKPYQTEIYQRLGITQACEEPLDPDLHFLAEEVCWVEDVHNFANCLASNMTWRQMMFKYSLPHGAAVLLSRDRQTRETGMDLLKKIIECVLVAEAQFVQSNYLVVFLCEQPDHDDLENGREQHRLSTALARKEDMVIDTRDRQIIDLLSDVGWQEEVLPRELMVIMFKSGYNAHDPEARKLMMRMAMGSSTTADILESVFAYLADMSSRHAKNKKMSNCLKWMCATCASTVKTSGVEQMLPAGNAWAVCRINNQANFAMTAIFNKLFKADTPMPLVAAAEGKEPAAVSINSLYKSKWRTGGPLSNQKSVAATGYMLCDSPKFENIGQVWAGQGPWSICFFIWITCGIYFTPLSN